MTAADMATAQSGDVVTKRHRRRASGNRERKPRGVDMAYTLPHLAIVLALQHAARAVAASSCCVVVAHTSAAALPWALARRRAE